MSTLNIQLKNIKDGATLTVAGRKFSGIDTEKVRKSLESRVACLQANRCNSTDQTVQEKLSCMNERARRRFGTTELRFPHEGPKVQVAQSDNGLEIQLIGPEARAFAKQLKASDLQARLEAELACQKTNRCGEAQQTPEQRLTCVTTTAKRRFGVK